MKHILANNLRDSILWDALTGKISVQNKTDTLVSETLKQCKEELEKYKWKSKTSKSIEETMETLNNPEIPKEWSWVKLSDIAYSYIGLTYSPSNVDSNGTVVLRSSNIQNGKIDYEDIVRVSMKIPESKYCHIGDILMCSRNGSKKLVGKTAIINEEGMTFGAFMAIIKSSFNKYLFMFFNSEMFKKQMHLDSSTETINQITQDMLFNCFVPFPPIEEQQRIVDKVEELMAKIDEYEKIENQLVQLKEEFPGDMRDAILQAAMQGKITEQLSSDSEVSDLDIEFENPDDNDLIIPDNWRCAKYQEFCESRMGKTILTKELKDNGIPVYSATMEGLPLGYLSSVELELKKNDIVIPARGNSIGYVKLIEDELATCTQTTICSQNIHDIDPKYLLYACKAFKAKWFKYTGSAIPQITVNQVNNCVVPLPPIEEQKRIVEKLDAVLPLCEQLERNIG